MLMIVSNKYILDTITKYVNSFDDEAIAIINDDLIHADADDDGGNRT